MRIDSQLKFVDTTAPQSIVAADGADVQLGAVIDLLGAGVGQAPPSIIGTAALWGQDPGVAPNAITPMIDVVIGTTFTTGNAATAAFLIQYAPDLGTPTYQPGTFVTASASGAIAVGQLVSGNVVARLDIPPTPVNVPRPRYMRLIMRPAASTHFTAGTISFAGVVPVRDDYAVKQATNNYTVA